MHFSYSCQPSAAQTATITEGDVSGAISLPFTSVFKRQSYGLDEDICFAKTYIEYGEYLESG